MHASPRRLPEGEDARVPRIVDEILAMKPEVIVIDGARVVRLFRERAGETPIVTAVVAAGLVLGAIWARWAPLGGSGASDGGGVSAPGGGGDAGAAEVAPAETVPPA